MCVRRYLGFVLLVCFQGVLHVQTSDQPCSAPSLHGGYWVPEQDTYNHEAKLSYGCDNGRKPAVEGWWATSTCEKGLWSPKPQCIDEKACVPPGIPNAIYTVSTNGWYEDNDIIRITCDNGYEDKQQDATAQCINGSWTSVPVCEKSVHACGEPPQIPHAVIILQGYQDFFAVDTELQYECEAGYTVDGAETKTFIYCISGNWSEGPMCSKWGSGPGTGHGGSGGHVTSTGSGTQPERGVNHCGPPPVVPNADIVGNDQMRLSYQCSIYYTLVGPEEVVCHTDGTWSEVPSCKATFCSVDTDQNPELISVGVRYSRDGQRQKLACVKKYYWVSDHFYIWSCTDGRSSFSKCVGTGGRQTTSAGRGTQPEGGDSRPGTGHGGGSAGSGTRPAGGDSRPGTGHGGGSAGSGTRPAGGDSRPGTGHGGGSAGSGTRPEGGASRPGTGHGGGSAGSGTRPAGGGTSTASGGNESDGRPQYTTVSVDRCGAHPQVPNGDVVQQEALFLRFQCNSFYTQVGSATVTCHSDGRWSPLPICKNAFCVMDPALMVFPTGLNPVVTYIKEGEEKSFPCTPYYYSIRVRCINRQIYWTRCCSSLDHQYGYCQ